MAIFGNTQYNPAQVMMNSGGGHGPYLNPSSQQTPQTQPPVPKPYGGGPMPPQGIDSNNPKPPGTIGPGYGTNSSPVNATAGTQMAQVPPSNILGSESVRAIGSGPFDQAYRQNLATYAGGQFQRPGGNLLFDPTGQNLFGNPTGGGTDPILGMGNSLIGMGLGGQPFSTPQPPQPAPPPQNQNWGGGGWQSWVRQLRDNMFGGGESRFAGLMQ